jgi:membrane protease YdiL (CAAX protease family)
MEADIDCKLQSNSSETRNKPKPAIFESKIGGIRISGATIVSSRNTLLRNTWTGLAITIGIVAATVVLVSLPASQFTDQAAREYVAGIARIILACVVTLVMRQRKWGRTVLTWPAPRSWAIILPVAAYSLIVYPLLFTGSLRLNLTQPNFAAGVGLNGFAAGALEELIFRGLILSLLLSGNSDDQNPTNTWHAIIISSLLFSVPHALNLFAGHAEARVVAQLIWAFLLGIVFACLRISGESIWPVAVLHGAMNAFVHVNRLGVEIQPSLLGAASLAVAPIPLCIYGAILLQKRTISP